MKKTLIARAGNIITISNDTEIIPSQCELRMKGKCPQKLAIVRHDYNLPTRGWISQREVRAIREELSFITTITDGRKDYRMYVVLTTYDKGSVLIILEEGQEPIIYAHQENLGLQVARRLDYGKKPSEPTPPPEAPTKNPIIIIKKKTYGRNNTARSDPASILRPLPPGVHHLLPHQQHQENESPGRKR